ncbi:MAG: isochorismatase family protein [Actinomycetota bacterium]
MIKISPTDALVVVDVQNDFCPGGALPVPEGDRVVAPINIAAGLFREVVVTRDAHPANHVSFIAQGGHWSPHCVRGTPGWELHPYLRVRTTYEVLKATDAETDQYSGFTPDLREHLASQGVRRVFVAGLALDYCVKATALDAKRAGFDTTVLTNATRAVNVRPGDDTRALDELASAGVLTALTLDLR